jgi:hypothetical protein
MTDKGKILAVDGTSAFMKEQSFRFQGYLNFLLCYEIEFTS